MRKKSELKESFTNCKKKEDPGAHPILSANQRNNLEINASSTNEESKSTERFWLDIKKITANWTAFEVNSLIRQELFGHDWHFVSSDRLINKLEGFSIQWDNESSKEIGIMDSVLENCSRLIDDPEVTIASRKKRQRLSFGEKMLIYKEITTNNSMEGLEHKFGTSKGTIYRVKKEFD